MQLTIVNNQMAEKIGEIKLEFWKNDMWVFKIMSQLVSAMHDTVNDYDLEYSHEVLENTLQHIIKKHKEGLDENY